MSSRKWLAMLVALMLPAGALAQGTALNSASSAPTRTGPSSNKVPNDRVLEALVKGSLLSLNDAVLTGNYTVFHAKLAKPFRQQFPPEKLETVFAAFAEKNLNLAVISTFTPRYDSAPSIDGEGRLLVKGVFPTQPSQVHFDLKFIPSENEWKLVGINVNVKRDDKP